MGSPEASEALVTDAAADELDLIIHHDGETLPVEILPAERWREWMNATSNRFANRCLPLLMANQAGWVMLNPTAFTATWDGGEERGSMKVVYDDPDTPPERRVGRSHFGYGIVSFSFRCFFETPEGYNLLARGPANAPKDGVSALEGLIETDWALVPFTMSWKLTRPGSVRFEAGEPFCQVVPQRRGELERFRPTTRSMDADPNASERAHAWEATRLMYMLGKRQMHLAGDEKYTRKWMDDYFRGQAPTGERGPDHQTTIRLKSL